MLLYQDNIVYFLKIELNILKDFFNLKKYI